LLIIRVITFELLSTYNVTTNKHTDRQTDGQHKMALPAQLLLRGAGKNVLLCNETFTVAE